jgi:hypothetical protein
VPPEMTQALDLRIACGVSETCGCSTQSDKIGSGARALEEETGGGGWRKKQQETDRAEAINNGILKAVG